MNYGKLTDIWKLLLARTIISIGDPRTINKMCVSILHRYKKQQDPLKDVFWVIAILSGHCMKGEVITLFEQLSAECP